MRLRRCFYWKQRKNLNCWHHHQSCFQFSGERQLQVAKWNEYSDKKFILKLNFMKNFAEPFQEGFLLKFVEWLRRSDLKIVKPLCVWSLRKSCHRIHQIRIYNIKSDGFLQKSMVSSIKTLNLNLGKGFLRFLAEKTLICFRNTALNVFWDCTKHKCLCDNF